MDHNFRSILFRLGIILITCGFFLGVTFHRWTIMPIAGLVLILPEAVEYGMLNSQRFLSLWRFGANDSP